MNKINKIMVHLEKHKKWINKFNYSDDLYQESILSLLKQGEERIIELYDLKQLDSYFGTVLKNTQYKSKSKHRRNFRDDDFLQFSDVIVEPERTATPEIDLDNDLSIIAPYWLDRELLKNFAMLGSVNRVSKLTGIDNKKVKFSINKSKKKMQ